MRTTDATLTAAQKAGGDALCKLVLSKSGQSDLTYSVSSTNRILDLSHPESEWSQTAQILIDNRDGNLTAGALEGWSGVISYGYNTADGDEYSATAPLTVIAQKADTIFRPVSDLTLSLSLAGLFDMWGEDKASETYQVGSSNTDTVKTIMDAVAGATLTPFDHCSAHTITYDSGYDDSIIDAFKPVDYFTIALNESRLSVFKKLMRFLKCKARVENDSGTATIHVFLPTITGSSYDYEYDDASNGHNFYHKSFRKRLVIPNRVVVQSHPDHVPKYSGLATDSDSYSALGRYIIEYKYLRVASNAEAARIAAAILQGYQVGREKGHGFAPMNVYQEVMDFVNITDSAAADRKGNIGYLNRMYRPGKFEFEFRFGSLDMGGLAGTLPPRQDSGGDTKSQSSASRLALLTDAYNDLWDEVVANRNFLITINEYLTAREEVVPKLHVTDQLIIPVH